MKFSLFIFFLYCSHISLSQYYSEFQLQELMNGNYKKSLEYYDSLSKTETARIENHQAALIAIDELEKSNQTLNENFEFSKDSIIKQIEEIESRKELLSDEQNDILFLDSAEHNIIHAFEINCKKPFSLKQDCSGFSGLKLKIKIYDYDLKIAGSEDGRTIAIQEANDLKFLFTQKYTLSSMNLYFIVRKILSQHNINVTTVHSIVTMPNDDLVGFVLELDGDGYSVLKQYK